MNSEVYSNTIASVYPDEDSAQSAVKDLRDANIDGIVVRHMKPEASDDIERVIEPDAEAVPGNVVKTSAVGGGAGTVAGAAVAGTAAVMAPTLFVSAPVIGPLMVLGYGAVIGGTVGAVKGLRLRTGMLSGLVKDALKDGHHVVIVHTASDEAQHDAETIIGDTLAEDTAQT